MKIKQLKTEHPRIYELAMLRQKEAGNEPNDDVDLRTEDEDDAILSFTWTKTIEGEDFWFDIHKKNFNAFYQRYPHTNDLPLINPEMLESDDDKIHRNEMNNFYDEIHGKDPINKAWHDKFSMRISEIIPKMNPDSFIKVDQPEAIKPDYYKFNIKGVDCDMFDIAESLQLPIRLFSALKYFRVKGDKAKQINDLEKAIECIKLEIERLKR